ncbi:MAG: Double zinc ribbon [Gemmatimonadetes bacterium]|nr:Double zinc ribbon [Gemmatimonadota bacterium]
MDDVDRMYRHLVRTIRATSPQLLTQPFQVGDLYSTILPYRLHRRELGVETNQDYEMAMLELLSGGRGYLAVDDRMRDELGAALRSPNPDPSVIRNFSSARVALAPEMLEKLEERSTGAPAAEADGPPLSIPVTRLKEPDTAPFRASATATSTAGTPMAASSSASPVAPNPSSASPTAPRATGSMTSAASASAGARRPTRPITVSPTGEQCPHCKGELPAGREIVFCPHCGQDLTVLHCPACGSELEHGWKFCVTCGRSAASA